MLLTPAVRTQKQEAKSSRPVWKKFQARLGLDSQILSGNTHTHTESEKGGKERREEKRREESKIWGEDHS